MKWTPGENRQLLILRDLNVPRGKIATYMNRSPSAVASRLYELRNHEYVDFVAGPEAVRIPVYGRVR